MVCIQKLRRFLSQWLMRLDKGRDDFIYAWRLSVFVLNSKSSEHSADGASVTAACSQLAISHAIFCEVLSCVLDTKWVYYGQTQLYWRRCSTAHVNARPKDEESQSTNRRTPQDVSPVNGFPAERLLLTQILELRHPRCVCTNTVGCKEVKHNQFR
jgi:hypothetical protein